MAIGARSQSAKTYLEKHFESFAAGAALAALCLVSFLLCWWDTVFIDLTICVAATMSWAL